MRSFDNAQDKLPAIGNSRDSRSNLRAFQNFQSWDFEAKKRFGLCVLDYAVTSKHIHLLVKKMELSRERGVW
ncbi:MAG: hypothetical protein QOD89_3018 [Bradyrhizobium sp.]|jgi:hypothetical protein|nr:hypothetical protein [Bradyrhizobium sp.]